MNHLKTQSVCDYKQVNESGLKSQTCQYLYITVVVPDGDKKFFFGVSLSVNDICICEGKT